MFFANWQSIIEAGEEIQALRLHSPAMQALHHSATLKHKLLQKRKLQLFKLIIVTILIYGLTERVQSQMQVSEMSFFCKIKWNYNVSQSLQESLNIEMLLLRIERSQYRWFGHVSRMLQELLSKQTLYAKVNGRKPVR